MYMYMFHPITYTSYKSYHKTLFAWSDRYPIGTFRYPPSSLISNIYLCLRATILCPLCEVPQYNNIYIVYQSLICTLAKQCSYGPLQTRYLEVTSHHSVPERYR